MKTLVELIQRGKKRTHAEKLEDLSSQSPPPIPEEFYNQLLRPHNRGFLLPSRLKDNFQKIHNQRPELMRLKQTYENENHVYYQNELQNISSNTSERSRHLGGCLSS